MPSVRNISAIHKKRFKNRYSIGAHVVRASLVSLNSLSSFQSKTLDQVSRTLSLSWARRILERRVSRRISSREIPAPSDFH